MNTTGLTLNTIDTKLITMDDLLNDYKKYVLSYEQITHRKRELKKIIENSEYDSDNYDEYKKLEFYEKEFLTTINYIIAYINQKKFESKYQN